jgi:cytochrome P450 / NADPH-cytochrome P450 reductase
MSCPFHKTSTDDSKPAGHPASGGTIDGPGEAIPHPPESWLVGNLREIDPAFAASSIWRLSDVYGPIYSLNLINRQVIVLSSFDLINEVCDDERFEKIVTGVLETVRIFVKNGLFTAYCDEEVSPC